jgi:tetratricopeptide (TPR) repeat protein
MIKYQSGPFTLKFSFSKQILLSCTTIFILSPALSFIPSLIGFGNAKPTDNRGVAFYHLGNYTVAITYYDKALAVDPKNAVALTYKGNFLIGIGNYKLANMYFDKALAINPKNVDAATGKRQAQAALSQPK